MKLYLIKFTIIGFLMLLIACDEILDPSSDYLIDKKINPSRQEQIFKIGNDFQIIIPANSLSGEIAIQVKKETNPPTFKFEDVELDQNVYQVKINKISSLVSYVNFVFRYSENKIPKGREVSSCVQTFLYSKGKWVLVKNIIDEQSNQVIVSVGNNLLSKNMNDDVVLLSNESEVIIAAGYKTNLTPINDSEQCDCGWEVDYTKLTKKIDTDENIIYYVNEYGQKHGPYLGYWDSQRTKLMLSQCFFNDVEHGLVSGYWPSGVLMMKTTYENGNRSGYMVSFFENGKKSSEGNWLNDKKDGLWIAWYENGNKYSEEFYIAGVKNGTFANWFENGKQEFAGIYKDDLKDGRWTYWYSNGQKKSDGIYKKDKKEGLWEYWYESGTMQLYENYKDGKWDGKSESYFENGNKKVTGSFTDGIESGIWCWYLENGLCKSCYDWDRGVEVNCP